MKIILGNLSLVKFLIFVRKRPSCRFELGQCRIRPACRGGRPGRRVGSTEEGCSPHCTAGWRKISLYLNMFGLAGISKASPLNQGCRHCLHFLFAEIGRLSYAKFPNPVYLLPPSQEAQGSSGLFELSSMQLPELYLPV